MVNNKYYRILGIDSKNVSAGEIKKAYKKLAIEYHPDRPRGNKEKFQQICEAYEIIVGKRQLSRAQRQEEAQPTTQHHTQREKYPPKTSYKYNYEPKREPIKEEYMYHIYDRCNSCNGQGKIIDYCVLCDATGNIVGCDNNDDTYIVICLGCNKGIKTLFLCQVCNGAGKVYNRTKKGYNWI